MTIKPNVGARIRLDSMPEDPCPIEPGSEGQVLTAHDWGDGRFQVAVKWDSGRSLALVSPPDVFTVTGRRKR